MLGGFLEYNSMYWGLGSLVPLGMALYTAAFVCHLARRPEGVAPGETRRVGRGTRPTEPARLVG
jgi:hypothetical protein